MLYVFVFVVCTCVYVMALPNIYTVLDNEVTSYNFPFVNRLGWDARTPTKRLALVNPVPFVVIHHSYMPGDCETRKECCKAMRTMQDMHMDGRGWWDVGYNFGVGGDGSAYEGRGWSTLGAHALHFNSVSIGICLIGNWRYKLPPASQIKTAKSLIAAGVDLGFIRPDYKLVGHRQVRQTECPGDALFQEIKTWDQYSPFPRTVHDLINVKEISDAVKSLITASLREGAQNAGDIASLYGEAYSLTEVCASLPVTLDLPLKSFYNFDFVPRKEWQARPPKEKTPLELPIPYVVIHHTYIPPVCYTKEKGCEVMRQIQDQHMDVNNWVDIGYNLAVGGDGTVYEGRGWTTLAAHAKNFNHVSLGVCLIGDWRDSMPPPTQLKAVHCILEAGVRLGYLKSDFKLIAHRQVKATECPGNALFEHIRDWENYSTYPSSFKDLLSIKEIPEDIRKEVAERITLE